MTDLVTCNAFGATNGETVIFEDGYCLVESISAEAACVGVFYLFFFFFFFFSCLN